MKQNVIKVSVLSLIFVVAVVVFSILTNQGNADLTADMDQATLPTISFVVDGYEVNSLAGYVNEMQISLMRNGVILADSDGSVSMRLHSYEQQIVGMTYALYSSDGTEKLLEKQVEQIEEEIKLSLGEELENRAETALVVTLQTEYEDAIHYYARVKADQEGYKTRECLDFVKEFQESLLTGTNTNRIKSMMESNDEGDNTTYGHVTIHSDLEHVTWGDLNPQLKGDIRWKLDETNEVYTGIQLKYQVVCAGDENEEELHNVQEYFRVRCVDGTLYLLDYDRKMNQVFEGSKKVLTSKGISLGISSEEIPYKVNQDGTISAFVKERELWCYDEEEDTLAQVFSFVEAAKSDVRNQNDQHSIRILSMDQDGNMTFGVYGYMNRGIHEGEMGAAIYYYNLSQNMLEEKIFIPTDLNAKMTENMLGKLAYYNESQDVMYVLLDGSLHKIHLQDQQREVVMEGLSEGQYVTSDDGRLLAYQCDGSLNDATKIVVWDLEQGKEQYVSAKEDTFIRPLGFVGDDFVYGSLRSSDAGVTTDGTEMTPMYQLEICNFSGEILKTYAVKGILIDDITIDGNMITLNRVIKRNQVYQTTDHDYITNHTKDQISGIALDTFVTQLKETQYRLAYEASIADKKAKVLRPKYMLVEKPATLDYESEKGKEQYLVYGCGELLAIYEHAGEAIKRADQVRGVVMTESQDMIWEMSNQHAWYRNFEIGSFYCQKGENSLEACLRKIASYEGISLPDDLQAKNGTEAVKVLNAMSPLRGINLTGADVEELRYLIGKGYPVLAFTGTANAVILIGYDAKTVTYADPASGSIRTCSMERMQSMTQESGNTFVGYICLNM